MSFQLTSIFFFPKQVYVVKRQHVSSLPTCIKSEISTVLTETPSFKEKVINTDRVGEIEAKVARKYLITDAASKEENELKYGDVSAVKLLSKTEYDTDCLDTAWTETEQREEEYAETRGRSESVATRFRLVYRQIKCYFSQPELGEKRMGKLL